MVAEGLAGARRGRALFYLGPYDLFPFYEEEKFEGGGFALTAFSIFNSCPPTDSGRWQGHWVSKPPGSSDSTTRSWTLRPTLLSTKTDELSFDMLGIRVRNDMILARWHRPVGPAQRTTILPDGCRDIVVFENARGGYRCLLSPLDDRPRAVAVAADIRIWGYRLHPSVVLRGDLRELLRYAPSSTAFTGHAQTLIERPPRLAEAVFALGYATSIEEAARTCGVTPRSLHRWFQQRNLPNPNFYLQLGRVRRAARAVAKGQPLADAAADFAYSDQSHMTRSFRRLLGQTPAAVEHAPNPLLFARGLGDG